MTDDFDRYRRAKKRRGGRTDAGGSASGWLVIGLLVLLNVLAWSYALPGYRAMVTASPDDGSSITAQAPPSSGGGAPSDSLIQPGTILTQREADELAVAFLDVGQGDAVFIQTPNNKNLLLDTGEGSNPDFKFARQVDAANELILPFFRRNKISGLDYFITSHPHSDHIGGAYSIIKEMTIDEIWAAGYNHPSRSKKDMLNAIKQKKANGANLTFKVPRGAKGTLTEGQKLDLGPSVKAWLLRTAPHAENVNQSSLVILLQYGEVGMLFTGDTERAGEKELIRTWGRQLDVDVLKVGHHGSRTSTILPFAKTVRPDYSVIMVGHYNTFGHPTKEVLSRLRRLGSTVYRTDKHGSIFMFTDGRSIDVSNVAAVSAVND